MNDNVFTPVNEVEALNNPDKMLYPKQLVDFEACSLMLKENLPAVDLNFIGLFAIYDKVAGMFSNVFNNTRVEVIQRDIAKLMEHDKSHVYSSHPENFDLFRLGTYHCLTGNIVADKYYICNLKEIKENTSTKL